jgi:DNA-binding transcriptional regulator YdaS (Cro superfamily)
MIRTLTAMAAGALILAPGAAFAQTNSTDQSTGTQEDRVGAILGTLFGDRLGVSTSVERQWAAGRKPLATQRTQFIARIDADVRSGALTAANGVRVKAEYEQLVALEARYGADNRFTTAERTELSDRYGALTQALTEGGYAEEQDDTGGLSVADGRTEFNRRVDAGVTARRLSRTEATRLKGDYAALIQTEASYARDGISRREREDLDTRLDALDARVGDTAYGGGSTVIDNRTRLSNVERALSASGLNAAAQAQVRVEVGDLTRLAAAYERVAPSSDDRSYLDRRIADLETRARVRR